jgi:Penicillin-insensitive murein endopeptidase
MSRPSRPIHRGTTPAVPRTPPIDRGTTPAVPRTPPAHRDPAARRPLAALLAALLAAVAMAGTLPSPAGVPHRDPSGSGAPTGRVAEPEKRLLAAVHRGARGVGLSAGVTERGRPPEASIRWRRSRALGRPDQGRLAGGVQLPAVGTHFVTVDPVRRASPSPGWRRWGTNRLVRVLLRVAGEHAAAHPGAPRLVVGDLSRPKGGRFGPEFGGDGHRSHQNGLDVDVYYPRRDGREKVPGTVAQVDRRLAQELVDRFVRAGAQYVFVGPRTRLRGPAKVVMVLGNHDDHLHVRLHPATRGRR